MVFTVVPPSYAAAPEPPIDVPEHPDITGHPADMNQPAFVPQIWYNQRMTSDILLDSDMDTERAVAQAFLRQLPSGYEVERVILFGSRARGDHRPDSDLELAVVLKGRRRDFIDTKLDMAGVAFDAMMATGMLVQPLPLWDDDLIHPERFVNPALIQNIALTFNRPTPTA
jgi:uncharacterized protein